MKRLALAALLATAPASPALAEGLNVAADPYYSSAQATLRERLSRRPNTNRAQSVILFVADGNGVGTNYAARLFQGQKAGNMGDEHVLPYEAFPHLALVKTYNVNAQTPDSAGTGSALHTGVKTRAGVIGVGPALVRGDCAATAANAVPNVAELYAEDGKAVGVVSTARITHATPASVYAHAADRRFEDDSRMPEGCAQKDIAVQLVEAMMAGRVDVALGGGRRHFIPRTQRGVGGRRGRRLDGRNLVAELKAAGATYIHDGETAKGEIPSEGPLLGLFEHSHMRYEHDRGDQPSLAEMTEIAIRRLRAGPDGARNGFFLHVEAGRVDHANHGGNLHRVLGDAEAFARAVARADALTDDADTLIIVTADHEHAIAFNGYCGRGSAVTGLCYKVNPTGIRHLDEPNIADDGKPYTVAGYLNGPGSILKPVEPGADMGAEAAGATTSEAAKPRTKTSGLPQAAYNGSRPDLTQAEATDPDYLQQALIPSSSESHSGEDVAVYAKGPFAHLLDGTVEQNYIFHVMRHATAAR